MAVSWDSNSISTLFSSLPSKNTGFFGTGSTSNNMLSDYYSIKNGSYHKLMKAYYSQDSDVKAKDSTKAKDTDKTAKETKKAEATVANDIKKAATNLKDSANALLDSKLYEKVSSTDKDGKTTEAVDTDKVYKAVNDFVDSYNKMIKEAPNSDTKQVLSNVASMTDYTRVNSKMLSKMGISIGDDNTLKIDEEKFINADMNDVKSLFGSRGGYGYQVSALASLTANAASNTFKSGYTNTGNYSLADVSAYMDTI